MPHLRAFALCALFAGTAIAAPEERPNILLIVLDTLRYDALSDAPYLSSLHERSIVFARAYSTHDFTPPSHFSILTGIPNGLGSSDDRPENGLPYQLRLAGYDTFGTIGNALLNRNVMPTLASFRRFNEVRPAIGSNAADTLSEITVIDSRLALFGYRPTLRNRLSLYYSAERLLPLFLDQIETAKPPFFGFINLLDAHDPYAPDPETYPPEASLPTNFSGDVLNRRLGPQLAHPELIRDPVRRAYVQERIRTAGRPALVSIDLSADALEIYRRRYRARIRQMDEQLRDFFDRLQKEKLLDNTIVIITSDHGESFGEADLITHNFHDRGDYESTHHVPLIIVLPRATTGRKINARVSAAQIAPTIYNFARIDWTALRQEHASYASSLFGASQPALTRVSLPEPRPSNQEATREREKTLRSLGYIQ